MATRRPDGPADQVVRDQLDPVVRDLGLVLDDVAVTTVGDRLLLRVVLDLPDEQVGSLSLDAVADAARAVSTALDEADPMGQSPYTLEVSSPGVERPLTEPRHLRRNVGRVVQLTLVDGGVATGRVLSVQDDDALVLLLNGAKKGMPATKQRVIAWADVVQGVVKVEFNRPDGGDDLDDDADDDEADDDEADDDEGTDDEADEDDDVTDGRS